MKRISIPSNFSIKAEVGYVGGLEAREKTGGQEGIDANDYTKVEDAVRFVNETEVDALAVAVGTIHGIFRFKPNLDFDMIKEIKDAVL